jgi:hypothetical protein
VVCSGGDAEDICKQVQSILPERINIGYDPDYASTHQYHSHSLNYDRHGRGATNEQT